MPIAVVVDDLKMDQRLVGALLEDRTELTVVYARNGRQALNRLEGKGADLVLTDMQMPEMNGLELVEALYQDYPAVPVILMTAHGSEDIAAEALKKGAASYVPKKSLARDLVPTVQRVLAMTGVALEEQAALEHMTALRCCFTLANDETPVPPLLNHLRKQCARMMLQDETQLTRMSVALDEAITNSIRHGNLQVGAEADLKDADALLTERRAAAPYAQRRIELIADIDRAQAKFVVRDEGPGFDHRSMSGPASAANLENTSGRGLLLIHTFMDEVRHNDAGNEITMVKRRHA